ncbi:hypothetical protein FK531_06690 [Rhodococcus spelaei]|uniref:TfoX N-terminal domain-containing protein n=1 Tax=Rhodococcus spelaei TaxID=2546320 RepID=A0A541BLP2_9NOCA|nr:hypothetical protein [Rhodococcus spelaei]TQF73218.1 hypothetical protein FK531_06690 [Rhodococcus spelaei]
MDPEERFSALVDHFEGAPGVTAPGVGGTRGFGSAALKVNGSIFAMLSHGRLVVKLPRERVVSLIADGVGSPYDAGKGVPMKEWMSVAGGTDELWRALGREALDFVGARRR